jgi:hypothetical protein
MSPKSHSIQFSLVCFHYETSRLAIKLDCNPEGGTVFANYKKKLKKLKTVQGIWESLEVAVDFA